MERQKWQEINRILEEALAFESRRRQAYLESLSIDEETLREVQSLLSFDDETDSAFDLSAVELSKDFIETEDENLLIGQQIGAYEIVSEIGYGGMGAVYLAKRNDEKFDQQVAIKMLRQEFNTAKIRKRFKREREIQAALVHPNVATLLDAGTTDFGVPFLAMEYVEGSRIDKYCFDNNLELNERLKLFNKVCEAVSFAHRNLIIHRDIKPSNIIVTRNGEPKLLDFGISKLIDKGADKNNTLTKLGAMTPEYASPEQIRGESVTTATDIYSLGVVLFKMLTGAMPFNAKDKSETELFHELTNSNPTRPSETTILNPKSSIYGSEVLKGDLDNIILKALRKKPERRYSSVEQFSADIWRFIDGLPVIARPATFSYRAKKFYSRNKIPVLAGSLVVLSLITGIVIALWQANVAREQAQLAANSQRKAELETEKAKAEEERAKKITEFMERIISYANPNSYAEGFESSGEAKVIDVLGDLSGRIETEFSDRLDIQSELHHKFAEVFGSRINKGVRKVNSEEIKKAKFHATRAIELRKKFYGEKHELVAKDMFYLWNLESALADDPVVNPGLLAQAIQMMRETNPTNLNLPHMLGMYGSRLYSDAYSKEGRENFYRKAIPKPKVGRLELAENYISEALSIFQTSYPDDEISIIYTQCNLAMVQIQNEKFAVAERNFRACERKITPKSTNQALETYRNYKSKLREGLNK